MPDVVLYALGGFIYLLSEKYRAKKQKEWREESELYKFHEIGMWALCSILILTLLVLAIINI